MLLHHHRKVIALCWMTVVACACTMSNTRPEQLIGPDAAVAAPHHESDGLANGSGGMPSSAPVVDASTNHDAGDAMPAAHPADPVPDAGTMMMPPPGMQPADLDAGATDALDASSADAAQPLPECAANFAVEVTACYLLDPTNPDCPRLADHCGLIDGG
jgi:hypothetical protein